jgi:hypothetical protein
MKDKTKQLNWKGNINQKKKQKSDSKIKSLLFAFYPIFEVESFKGGNQVNVVTKVGSPFNK